MTNLILHESLTRVPRKIALPTIDFRQLHKNPYVWAILLRVLYMVLVPRHWMGDAVDYEQLASNLAEGRGFSRCFSEPFRLTAQRPPLYPLVLALFYMMGMSHRTGPIFLNIAFDLLSMNLAKRWGVAAGLKRVSFIPWVVGLCPLLITYGMYPTTENLSVTLFFAAMLLTFKDRPNRMTAFWAGLMWGLVTLCRSYFLLFPIGFAAMKLAPVLPAVVKGPLRKLFEIVYVGRKWQPKAIVIFLAMSFAAPTVWMIRNTVSLGRVSFTQTSMVGWQSYQGVCFANFDWWKPEHLGHMYATPVLAKMISSHCAEESVIAELDAQVKDLVRQCIVERPWESLRNVVAKGINLFINWGLLFPYDRMPFLGQHFINALLCLFWFTAARLIWSHRKALRPASASRDVVRFSVLCILYIVGVTIPFAVDARYLLAPFLTLLIVCFEISKGPVEFLRAALPRGPKSSEKAE